MRKAAFMLMSLFITLSVYAQKQKVKHVVLIGCDGFGAYALPEADMPNQKGLMKDGAWSLKARSVLPSSSAVNWASMIMGAGPTLHGYTEWNSAVPEIPSAEVTKEGIFPSVFSILKEQKPSAVTALIYSWQGIDPLVQKGTTDIRIPAKDDDDFCTNSAVEVIKSRKPTLTFVHLDQPDCVGHNIGHRTPAYYEELKKVDARSAKL